MNASQVCFDAMHAIKQAGGNGLSGKAFTLQGVRMSITHPFALVFYCNVVATIPAMCLAEIIKLVVLFIAAGQLFTTYLISAHFYNNNGFRAAFAVKLDKTTPLPLLVV